MKRSLLLVLLAANSVSVHGQAHDWRQAAGHVLPLTESLNLDAPPDVLPDWTLPVSVGQTRWQIPRAELKQWVLRHSEWRQQ